MYLYR